MYVRHLPTALLAAWSTINRAALCPFCCKKAKQISTYSMWYEACKEGRNPVIETLLLHFKK